MALQDLIISQSKISEELIENLLKEKVQLIEENSEVYLLPNASRLPSNLKILLYLSGKKAWSLIKNEEIVAPLVELSNNLGIKGNTLRPLLKQLRDARLVESNAGRYFILPTGIEYLRQSSEQKPAEITNSHNRHKGKQATKLGGKVNTKGVAVEIRTLINEDFFKQPRSLTEIQEVLKKKAINIAMTSLPGYVISLVRKGSLKREKETRNKKVIWVYEASMGHKDGDKEEKS